MVIVEAIYYRLQRGDPPREAVVGGVEEVGLPVLSSVLTTIAAFLPLMLLPGILGKFMFVVPFVVTVGLLVTWSRPTGSCPRTSSRCACSPRSDPRGHRSCASASRCASASPTRAPWWR